MEGLEVEYGLLGVFVRSPDDDERVKAGGPRSRGALIDGVDVGSPAEKARLQSGDLIVKFDGQDIFDPDHLVRIVGSTPPGQPVDVVFYRKETRRTVSLTLAHRRHHPSLDRVDPVHWRGMTFAPVGMTTSRDVNVSDNDSGNRRGMKIVAVRPISQAARAGLRSGMVLDRFGDHTVTTHQGLRDAIRQSRAQPVDITVRAGKRFRLLPLRPSRPSPRRRPGTPPTQPHSPTSQD
jgi:serine protease Do